nr:hypothetical protein [uncultured Holophaga sp.]
MVSRVMEAWQAMLLAGGEEVDSEAVADLIELMAGAAGRPAAWVRGLCEADFERLLSMLIALNQDLFEPPSEDGASLGWPDLIQRLVGHGHAWNDVQSYTLPQARAFIGATLKEDRSDQAARIVAATYSMADPKETKSAIQELRRG